MLNRLERQRDYYAGALMAIIGVLAGYVATTYDIGSLRAMGPGFFPLVLSVLITCLGIAIAATGGRSARARAYGAAAHGHRVGVDLRGWTAIFGAVLAFIAAGYFAGMAPATFACVFIAALGDRQNTWKSAGLLALGLTAFAVVVLAWGLQVQMPILKGL
jgi:hypothetical protein